MTPGFALSLSFDGILLMTRAAGGWRVAGRVPLSASDLSAELAELRERAVLLSDPAFRTKLIIPNDQIRYLTVDTGHVATADRIAQVRAALDGATPYPVEDLVYDICVDGPLTHVAAVARDTLEEAESFALEHRFNPVSFVAIPENAAFLGEPFFGPTHFSETALATGERVEPDGIAVVVIGDVEEPGHSKPASERASESKQNSDSTPVSEEAAPTPAPEFKRSRHSSPTSEPEAPTETVESATPVPGFSSRRSAVAPAQAPTTPSTISPQIAPEDLPPKPIDAPEQPPLPEPPRPRDLSASFAPPKEPDADYAVQKRPVQTWKDRFLKRQQDAKEPAPQPSAPPVPRPVQPAPQVTQDMPAPRRSPELVAALPEPDLVAPRLGGASAPNQEREREREKERERMTIFGMREGSSNKARAPRHMGLILTVVLLVFLAGVAAWASVFLDDRISALFDRGSDLVEVEPDADLDIPRLVTAPQNGPTTELATLSPVDSGLTETDTAVLDALRSEPSPVEQPDESAPIAAPEVVPDPEVEARYAVTGIWHRAPEMPSEPGLVSLDDLYLTSIDPAVDTRDAIALPDGTLFDSDRALGEVTPPVSPGAEFSFGPDGRVIPTPEGALTPDGYLVIEGRPAVVAPPTPPRGSQDEADTTQPLGLTDIRPRLRPGNLVEQVERSQLGGLTLSELSGVRPLSRPEVERAEDEADETPTALAVQASATPRLRPADIAERAAAAARVVEPEQDTDTDVQVATASTAAVAPTVQARAVAPATVAPRIPSSASVARAATLNNAINLRRVNLIGVYGTQANRRALVRLPNGRYRKVEVGDRLDGGRVSAIGDSELRYQKGGRNLVLRIPSG